MCILHSSSLCIKGTLDSYFILVWGSQQRALSTTLFCECNLQISSISTEPFQLIIITQLVESRHAGSEKVITNCTGMIIELCRKFIEIDIVLLDSNWVVQLVVLATRSEGSRSYHYWSRGCQLLSYIQGRNGRLVLRLKNSIHILIFGSLVNQ